ncbi:hypothetical protein JZ751_021230 [Albula glossodonta]|uniref:Prostate transmembrane protein, androgen induced 1 n=1 Tax=Albula glossodonta TaxID=121402 RepID=A0A8T2NKV5_9TELE|nr:hypothetical protein JZ751_021230 [Albula glossodonta]
MTPAPLSLCHAAQLEFVQILVIVVVMMVMVVVITCLLNHYRLSARSFISRHSQARRRHLPLASRRILAAFCRRNESAALDCQTDLHTLPSGRRTPGDMADGSLWPSDGSGPSSGMSEQQVYTPRPPDRVTSYLQRERLARFQPTYPYLPHAIIDLPPTISLSDGEEPPPYQGPCTLQLRDPEQQLELNRESVRAPPNRTVFDSHLIDTSLCPPSLNAGVSATAGPAPGHARVEGAPPTYSEVIGHYYHATLPRHQTAPAGGVGGNGPPPPPQLMHGVLQHSHVTLETRNARNKEKQQPQQV